MVPVDSARRTHFSNSISRDAASSCTKVSIWSSMAWRSAEANSTISSLFFSASYKGIHLEKIIILLLSNVPRICNCTKSTEVWTLSPNWTKNAAISSRTEPAKASINNKLCSVTSLLRFYLSWNLNQPRTHATQQQMNPGNKRIDTTRGRKKS